MKKVQHVVLFANAKAQFGVLEVFTLGLQKAFLAAGIACDVMQFSPDEEDAIYEKLSKTRPDCTVGFNMVVAPDIFYSELGICHLSLLVDAASYFVEVKDFYNCIVGCVEEDSCHLLRYMGHQNPLYVPHAVDAEVVSAAKTKRDLDLVMPASFYDAEAILENWQVVLSKQSLDVLLSIAEGALSSDSLWHTRLLLEELSRNSGFANELSKKGISPVVIANSLDRYIRGRDRIRFLQAIDVCDVHVYGDESEHVVWKKALSNKNNIYFHSPLAFKEIPALFSRAKCVLNSAPMIKHGYHERTLMALARGASVLGSATAQIGDAFGDAFKGISSPEYGAANAWLEKVLSNESARFEAVLATHEQLVKDHTWDARVAMLKNRLPPLLESVKCMGQR